MSTVRQQVPQNSHLDAEDEGYHKALKPRQLQMIAIGGAIGTGLFMGAAQRLHHAGPGLFIVYGVCGIFVYFILRALGELVLHRPSSGSFVSYAREFFGEKAAFVAGWMYFLNWSMTGIVDSTAIAQYFHYWTGLRVVPQWLIALVALALVVSVNMVSVKWFGEMEFWAALVKVVALVAFLIVGVVFLVGRFKVEGQVTGPSVISENHGIIPTGFLPLLLVTSGVVFAYAGVELVGIAAGETAEPHKIMPRAINSVIFRIALFYVGSLILLGLLLPYTSYHSGESPFVTFFSKLGVSGAGDVMNIVVLTAAFSSLNSGLYSTGRILKSMAMNGSAPKFTARMSRTGVPYGGILLTSLIGLCGVLLNMKVPHKAFEIVLEVASLGIIASWATIVLCQLQLWRWSRKGKISRPAFRMPGAPYTGIATLVFLVGILVLMAFSDDSTQRWVVASLVVIGPLLAIGWLFARRRVLAIADERAGYTGEFPVLASSIALDEAREEARALEEAAAAEPDQDEAKDDTKDEAADDIQDKARALD